MNKFLFLLLIVLVAVLPLSIGLMQADGPFTVDITGINARRLPEVTITVSVRDASGRFVSGLTAENFQLAGEFAAFGEIVSVESSVDSNLPFATVLMIDVSTSMEGTPIARARDAARAFVELIADNNPIAVMTFGTDIELVQGFTTNKDALLAAIDGITAGGQTALYQGAYEAVSYADSSPLPRRAVILLSDGAEFGGRSQVTAEEATTYAAERNMPVYTIGLGFGPDRSFLQALSSASDARHYESPTVEELAEIYRELAALFTSQYVVTVTSDIPLDGRQYALEIIAQRGTFTASDVSVLRAPIPVPLITFAGVPDQPIDEPTEITATIRSDDPIAAVTFELAGVGAVPFNRGTNSVVIDPVQYAPGSYTLTVQATDATGDVGSQSVSFEIAALPSTLEITPDLTTLGEIAQPVEVALRISGQTPPAMVTYRLGDGELIPLDTPYTFTIDPETLPPGSQTLFVEVINEGGASTTRDVPFMVAALPPRLIISGLEDGQTIDAPLEFEVRAEGQSPAVVTVTLGSQLLNPIAAAEGRYTLDPQSIAPGAVPLTVLAESENGTSASETLTLNIAALPPEIIVSGLADGETIAEARSVTVDFISQTPVNHVAWFLDDRELAHQVQAPFGLTIDPLRIGVGGHTLRIAADSQTASRTVDIRFTVDPSIGATLTALAPTPTFTPTPSPDLTIAAGTQQAINLLATQIAENATGTAVQRQATLDARVTQTAQAQSTQQAAQTQSALDAQSTATANALGTLSAQGTSTQIAAQQATSAAATQAAATQVQGTRIAQAATESAGTQQAQATQAASATQGAATHQARATENQATIDARATLNAQATADTRATAITMATQSAQRTQDAGATATVSAQRTGTVEARQAATAAAIGTATQSARSTAEAQATLDTRAMAAALATTVAEQTASARATTEAAATAAAISQATANAVMTEQAATREAENAIRTATAQAQRTQIAQAATATQSAIVEQINQTATRLAADILTETASVERQRTLSAAATATAETRQTATAEAQATQTAAQAQTATSEALARAATQAAETASAATAAARAATSEARAAERTATAETRQTATAEAQATQTAEAAGTATAEAAQATEEPTEEATEPATGAQTAEETEAVETPTVQPTLIPIEAQTTPAGDSTIGIVLGLGIIALVLIVLYALLRRRRS